MGIDTAAGATLAIGTTVSATIQSEFEADSYTAVGEVEDMGEFGDSSEEVTFTALGDRRVRKFKGSRDAGTMSVVCGFDATDGGQDAMAAAEASDSDYNFKVILDDELTIAGVPTTIYFRGKVMSQRKNVGNVSNIVRHNFDIAINSDFVQIDAT